MCLDPSVPLRCRAEYMSLDPTGDASGGEGCGVGE